MLQPEALSTPETLARAAAQMAAEVETAVYEQRQRADRALSQALRGRRDLAPPDQKLISLAVFALFRWRGWVDPLTRNQPITARLLLSTLLDAPVVPGMCRVWARELGRNPAALLAIGDAPSWTAKVEGLRRLMGGRAITGDPWRLFPEGVREHLPVPPGEGSTRVRYAEFLRILQTRSPLWVRAQGDEPEKVWEELRALGLKPWIHRRLKDAARIDEAVDVYHLPPFVKGRLEIQDLASQAVGRVCDPEPGERWWDACAGAGGKALELASIMGGKGTVVATDTHPGRLKETVRRARKSPFRNIATRDWDGKHVAGKAGSYAGVLVDAPCSAIGTWRRNPDARWLFDPASVDRLAAVQAQLLHTCAAGVKVGGTLAYSVCTPTQAETTLQVKRFLDTHPAFALDPFPHPFTGEPTDGTLLIWPAEADTDLMFIARFTRKTAAKPNV